MACRILLAEDEENLAEIIRLILEIEGYHVVWAKDGKTAIKLFNEARFDLLLLDVMLPEIDGFTVAETIRMSNTSVPIFFITAKNTSADRIRGLKIGGGDYLTKPFNLEELLLRVQSLVKRGSNAAIERNSFKFKGNAIYFTAFEAINFKGEKFELSKKESALLKLLIDRSPDVVSRKEILDIVWGVDVYPSTRTIDNFILQFRKYFEPDAKEPVHFQSIRGVGYRFLP